MGIYVQLCDQILQPGLVLDLDLSQLVALSTAVAKAGMGGHPIMNTICNILILHLARLW